MTRDVVYVVTIGVRCEREDVTEVSAVLERAAGRKAESGGYLYCPGGVRDLTFQFRAAPSTWRAVRRLERTCRIAAWSIKWLRVEEKER